MSNHEFTLILDHAPSGEELDALFEAGCDDDPLPLRSRTALLDPVWCRDRHASITTPESVTRR